VAARVAQAGTSAAAGPPTGDDVLREVERNAAQGQQRLAEVMRMLAQRQRPDLCVLLELGDDRIFLEPLLFSYFAGGDGGTLEQVFARYLPRGALADAAAVAADTELVAATTIELYRRLHPLHAPLFAGAVGAPDLGVATSARRHADHLATALRLIAELYPTYYRALVSVTRAIVVFSAQGVNSFAAPAAHGVAFLNSCECDDEIFFVEDLAHQCGHVLFAAATLDRDAYFAVDSERPAATMDGDDEVRSLYVVLHGVFTEMVMTHCLERCLDSGRFAGRQLHELEGRLAFVLARYASDLAVLAEEGIFTTQGRWLFAGLLRAFEDAVERRGAAVGRLRLGNQPYNFSYERFAAANPRA
jgi:hypothetical protein